MRPALLILVGLAAPARADVAECPRLHPEQHARLSGAGMFVGERGGQGELAGERREARGGWDAQFGFAVGDQRWLVCMYGARAEITWWKEMDARSTNCALQVRGSGGSNVSARATCK